MTILRAMGRPTNPVPSAESAVARNASDSRRQPTVAILPFDLVQLRFNRFQSRRVRQDPPVRVEEDVSRHRGDRKALRHVGRGASRPRRMLPGKRLLPWRKFRRPVCGPRRDWRRRQPAVYLPRIPRGGRSTSSVGLVTHGPHQVGAGMRLNTSLPRNAARWVWPPVQRALSLKSRASSPIFGNESDGIETLPRSRWVSPGLTVTRTTRLASGCTWQPFFEPYRATANSRRQAQLRNQKMAVQGSGFTNQACRRSEISSPLPRTPPGIAGQPFRQ